MTIYSADEIHKALSLYTKCRDANDRSGGKLFDTPMDEEIPSNLAVLADYNKVFDALIDEGVLNDRPNGEELEKFIRGLLPPKDKPKIHYYKVYFGSRKDYEEGEQPCICIEGIRKPTIEEANRFCKVDTYYMGAEITEVDEIDEHLARDCFSMRNDVPVFGIDEPRGIGESGFNRFELQFIKRFRAVVYAWNRDIAEAAFIETITDNPSLIVNHWAKFGIDAPFIAAVHGGLEPIPPDEI